MPPSIGVGVGVCVIKKGTRKVLVGKRKVQMGNGCYSFPGGHLEYGESWEECAQRELKEECNLSIAHPTFIHVQNDVQLDIHKHYVTLFICGETDQEPTFFLLIIIVWDDTYRIWSLINKFLVSKDKSF